MSQMQTELEVKILNINTEKIIKKLEEIWAKKQSQTKIQKRYVYDFSPPIKGSWIRLRDNWNTVTLAIKEIKNDRIDGTKELETTVWSFDTTNEILKKLWYKSRSYQENKRTSYTLDNVNIEIDERPRIPPYIEIEANTIEAINSTVEKLWFSMENVTSENTNKIYLKYGIDIEKIDYLNFN